MARTFLFLAILAAAAGIPILMSNDRVKWNSQPSLTTSAESAPDVRMEQSLATGTIDKRPQHTAKRPIDPELYALLHPRKTDNNPAASRITPVPDILRFDVTPAYVAQTWPRVSTTLSELELRGMRVPFVTGTRPQDLHGAVTYFFNRDMRTQRITLHGYTGDSEPLVQFVQSMYLLREYASVGERVFVAHQNGQPLSLLRIRNAPVMAADRPYTQQEVSLELNAPTKDASLSADSLETLQRMQNANLL